ncbi:MAG: ECF-type sigma factor [Gemmataceae bacterium]
MTRSTTSVTPWLKQLRDGDLAAVGPLWERCYADLVWHARQKLPRAGDVDSHLVAASAFDSFYLAAAAGRFPDLQDRHGLWPLLISITARKVADTLQKRNAQKRGGGRVNLGGDALDMLTDEEPTPEFAASMAEEFQALLAELPTEELRQVAVWKMEGYTDKEIATKIGRSVRSVANRLKAIRDAWSGREDS